MSAESTPQDSPLSLFSRYGQTFRLPTPLLILADFRFPEDILEDLRKADPDGHANLTEHLVVPKR